MQTACSRPALLDLPSVLLFSSSDSSCIGSSLRGGTGCSDWTAHEVKRSLEVRESGKIYINRRWGDVVTVLLHYELAVHAGKHMLSLGVTMVLFLS